MLSEVGCLNGQLLSVTRSVYKRKREERRRGLRRKGRNVGNKEGEKEAREKEKKTSMIVIALIIVIFKYFLSSNHFLFHSGYQSQQMPDDRMNNKAINTRAPIK